jgi:hypothetical protein
MSYIPLPSGPRLEQRASKRTVKGYVDRAAGVDDPPGTNRRPDGIAASKAISEVTNRAGPITSRMLVTDTHKPLTDAAMAGILQHWCFRIPAQELGPPNRTPCSRTVGVDGTDTFST